MVNYLPTPNELERQLKKYGVRFVEKMQEVCKKYKTLAKRMKAMREIEFRGKQVNNREWIHGDLQHGFVTDLPYINGHDIVWGTLGQYTGLKDKDGTKIYEGDILGGELVGCGVVYWDKNRAGFVIECSGEKDEVWFEELSRNDLEVIGNIYDNPELLEVK